jgi:hypothetical protein
VAERRVAVGWWPDRPSEVALDGGCDRLAEGYVFPSGRAAIRQALQIADLALDAAIAVAGHGSECLARVVRGFGQPVEIGGLGPSVRAAVVYEQWGWPLTDDAWHGLTGKFNGRLLILDRVDSADFFSGHQQREGCVEILSLSKLLGLDGGGLARTNGCFINFEPQPTSDVLRRLSGRPLSALSRGGYREVFKDSRHAVHPAALAWLQHNCLTCAAEAERAARQRHLQLVLDGSLAAGWPAWMVDAITAGAGPVWAPVLRGREAAWRWRAMSTLDQRYGVVSASRLFNWSGNPLRPDYEMCLALPVHAGVTDFSEIVAALG